MNIEGNKAQLPMELGKWVKPFINYRHVPYWRKAELFHQKVIEIQLENAYKSSFDVTWNASLPNYSQPHPSFYFDGIRDKNVLTTDIKKQEQLDEIRIVSIEKWLPILCEGSLGIPLFLKFPNGKVLHQIPNNWWAEIDSDRRYFEVLVPETDYALSKVELKVDLVQF